jgi:DNA-binding NarL/FixJ family response regulator
MLERGLARPYPLCAAERVDDPINIGKVGVSQQSDKQQTTKSPMSYDTSERPLVIEMIRAEQRAYSDRMRKAGKHSLVPEQYPAKSMFTIRSANHWMEIEQKKPMPKMLFGEFWYEGELCILFADTNAGKSILAVQIGNALARHEPIGDFGVQADEATVVYIDFEMSGKQFQSRYTGANDVMFDFAKGFYRAGFNPNADMPIDFTTYDEYMNAAIEYAVKATKANVLIIDNITCLRRGTERATDALPLMKHLKALKAKYNLSILVLAHTPKRYAHKPISRNDLQGSKMLINFADSAFAIGESSKEKGLRYLKQVKQRHTGRVYGEENICLCRITKPQNFIKYEFDGYGREADHLLTFSRQEREARQTEITALAEQGLSQRQISKQLGIGLGTVNRVVSGVVIMPTTG